MEKLQRQIEAEVVKNEANRIKMEREVKTIRKEILLATEDKVEGIQSYTSSLLFRFCLFLFLFCFVLFCFVLFFHPMNFCLFILILQDMQHFEKRVGAVETQVELSQMMLRDAANQKGLIDTLVSNPIKLIYNKK